MQDKQRDLLNEEHQRHWMYNHLIDFVPHWRRGFVNMWSLLNTTSNCVHSRYTTQRSMSGCRRVLRGSSVVGSWTCDLQVAGSIPAGPLSRNIGQLSLASLRGR